LRLCSWSAKFILLEAIGMHVILRRWWASSFRLASKRTYPPYIYIFCFNCQALYVGKCSHRLR
jgi:hypothetical protein